MNCMIYCRKRNIGERYGAMDVHNGSYGVNLMFATLFRSEDRAKQIASELAASCPDYEFQVRKAGTSTVVLDTTKDVEYA